MNKQGRHGGLRRRPQPSSKTWNGRRASRKLLFMSPCSLCSRRGQTRVLEAAV